MGEWDELADDFEIEKTVSSLKANGINAFVAGNAEEARKKVLELIPEGAEVMNMTSATLESAGIAKEIIESGKFDSVRKKFAAMDKSRESEKRKLGAAPDWAVGSVHAVTQDGKVLVASATGSQLPAYAYGAGKVIWVVGTQKIVKNLGEAFKRLEEYVFPLEDARAKKAYGVGSGINKILIVNKEFMPERITLVFVKEKLGF
ncbi:MAG: LUD domain-containing protein [Candidatus Norongarragalinales archaeon]